MVSTSGLQKFVLPCLAAGAMLCGSITANASISLSGTRLVLLEQRQEASIVVRNGATPVLAQAWLETNSPNDADELPFAVVPPLSKLPAQGQQLLRVIYAGGDSKLPQDRESVLWLNVQEIPQSTGNDNQLQIAIRQRIKVFYRPIGLQGSADEAPAGLRWSMVQDSGKPAVQISNPSAFHVSMTQVFNASNEALNGPGMIAPHQTVTIPAANVGGNDRLSFRIVDDYGGNQLYNVQLSGISEVNGIRALDKKTK